MLGVAFATTLLPVAALALAAVVFPVGYFLTLVGFEFGAALATVYEGWLRAVFAPSFLPVYLPRLVVIVVASLLALLALDAIERALRPRMRRIARGGLWWRLLGAPIDHSQAVSWFSGGLWQIMHGSRVQRPTDDELGRRYAELLQENLGQPGFRELLMLVHDVDARRDITFALLAEPYRKEFLQSQTGADGAVRPLEAVDLTRAPQRHAMDAFAAALSLPVATDPPLRDFRARQRLARRDAPALRPSGEHGAVAGRSCEGRGAAGHPGLGAAIGGRTPMPSVPRVGTSTAEPGSISWPSNAFPCRMPSTPGADSSSRCSRSGRAPIRSVPSTSPVATTITPTGHRRSTSCSTAAAKDGFRQFVDAVLGASGELIEVPPADRVEPPESFSARLAGQD